MHAEPAGRAMRRQFQENRQPFASWAWEFKQCVTASHSVANRFPLRGGTRPFRLVRDEKETLVAGVGLKLFQLRGRAQSQKSAIPLSEIAPRCSAAAVALQPGRQLVGLL